MKRPRDSRLDDPARREPGRSPHRMPRQSSAAGWRGREPATRCHSNWSAANGGAVLASYQGTASTTDLLSVVDGLTRKLRGKVGESFRQVQHSVPLERATTTSLEALRKYSEAVVANDINADYARATAVVARGGRARLDVRAGVAQARGRALQFVRIACRRGFCPEPTHSSMPTSSPTARSSSCRAPFIPGSEWGSTAERRWRLTRPPLPLTRAAPPPAGLQISSPTDFSSIARRITPGRTLAGTPTPSAS